MSGFVQPTSSPMSSNWTSDQSLSLSGTAEYPLYIRSTASVLSAAILFLGTLGNLLVPLVILRSKELRNTTNYFLINLSVADLLVIVVCMPTVLIELHSKPEVWVLGAAMCKAIPYVETSVAHGSILTMLAISFERYYAICKPLKVGYKCTKLRALLIILLIWLLALLATLPLLFIAQQSSATYVDGSQVQVCLTQANSGWSKAYFLTILTLFFFLPLLVLLVVYAAISRRLCSNENAAISYAECVQQRARRQVVLMLATVIICFFVCLLPFRLFTLWLLFSTSQQLTELGMETYYGYLFASRIMLYLNSALNPLLYNLISSKFRAAFLAAIRCQNSNSPANRLLTRQCTFNTTSSGSGQTGSLKQPVGSRLSRQTLQCSLASSVGSQASLAGGGGGYGAKCRPPLMGLISELNRAPFKAGIATAAVGWTTSTTNSMGRDSPNGFGSIGSSGSLVDRINTGRISSASGDQQQLMDGRRSANGYNNGTNPATSNGSLSMQKLRQQQFRRQYAKQRSLDHGGRIGSGGNGLSARKLLHYDQSFDRLFEEDLPFHVTRRRLSEEEINANDEVDSCSIVKENKTDCQRNNKNDAQLLPSSIESITDNRSPSVQINCSTEKSLLAAESPLSSSTQCQMSTAQQQLLLLTVGRKLSTLGESGEERSCSSDCVVERKIDNPILDSETTANLDEKQNHLDDDDHQSLDHCHHHNPKVGKESAL